MKKSIKIIGGTLIAMTIFASNALAEVPSGSVILGDKSYSLDYVNNPSNETEISEAFRTANFKVYVRTFAGEYVDNATEKSVDTSVISPKTYKDASGEKVIDSTTTSNNLEVISIE